MVRWCHDQEPSGIGFGTLHIAPVRDRVQCQMRGDAYSEGGYRTVREDLSDEHSGENLVRDEQRFTLARSGCGGRSMPTSARRPSLPTTQRDAKGYLRPI